MLLATAYAWLTAMMVIALVPIDVWAAYIMSSATEPIFIMWNIAYWCDAHVCCGAGVPTFGCLLGWHCGIVCLPFGIAFPRLCGGLPHG